MSNKSKIIVLDAGHGGYDAGATGQGYLEKDVALRMTLLIGKYLTDNRYTVIYTRDTDRFISLGERSAISNKYDTDVYLSIHVNSTGNISVAGQEIFHHNNQNIAKNNVAKSKELANLIYSNLQKDDLIYKDRGVKSANFAVIRNTKAPATLHELAFIRNKADMDFLFKNFDRIASSIASSLASFVGGTYKDSNNGNDVKTDEKLMIKSSIMGQNVLIHGYIRKGVSYVIVDDIHIKLTDLLEDLGFVVWWDSSSDTIMAELSYEYKPELENIEVYWFGIKMNFNGYIKNGVTMVKIKNNYIPLRHIMDNIGMKVDWSSTSNATSISVK